MRPEDTQRCVPDPEWETPQQEFEIALAKQQAEIDELEQFCINIYMSLHVSELYKVTAPVEESWHKGQKLWLRNTKHKGESYG